MKGMVDNKEEEESNRKWKIRGTRDLDPNITMIITRNLATADSQRGQGEQGAPADTTTLARKEETTSKREVAWHNQEG